MSFFENLAATVKVLLASPWASDVPRFTVPTLTFDADRKTKQAFLAVNAREIDRMISHVNTFLTQIHGQNRRLVTKHDVWALLNCEAGITANGLVDPDYDHPAHERGLLPLPENVSFWNGPSAPAWNKPMSLEENFYNFTLYLGRIKNKKIVQRHGYSIYDGLFSIGGIDSFASREARMVACVVHGYFMDGNFDSGTAPFGRVITGIKTDQTLMDMLRGTGFSREPTLRGREGNIAEAFRWLGTQGSPTRRIVAVETSLFDRPNGNPISYLPEGQVIEVVETVDADWIKGVVDSETGYVMVRMLRIPGAAPLQS